ncbi:MAG: alanine--tRNA ligase [Candidatus Altiarchaeales archaeon]|nr:MAG: alanine--tRNA ligase [Candidatus Altiarchaeales archaeon]
MPEYEVELFREEGFVRKKCPRCNRFFWTLSDSETCGEPPCEEYSFIGDSPMRKRLTLSEMREFYLSFFEKRGHTRIPRYPIIARWRDDIFFTIASISCFQPWVLNQTIDPPANPLVMSQPCLRFNDIDNVGKTGRHLTEFEMMAHHAFNTEDRSVYFKDRTVELCHSLLLELGINPEEINYLEAEWSGGGNSGPCFEVVVGGVELATLVFMMYEDTPAGKREMEMQVVDTGYGLERFVWLSRGTPNTYEAIFDYLLSELKREIEVEEDEEILSEYSRLAGMMNVESKADLNKLRRGVADRLCIPVNELIERISPLEDLYAVCDHTRALMFMLNDGGIVPSNVKAGYFARLLVRRALRSLKALDLRIPLRDILSLQIEHFKGDFPELMENRDDILALIDVEEKKYEKTIIRGKNIVSKLDEELKKEGKDMISTKDLIRLYDSHGLVPEIVSEFSGLRVEIPDDFYIRVAGMHEKIEEEKTREIEIPEVRETELKFYEDPYVKEFKARVLKKFNGYIILDKTYFYPEGGGQEPDFGKIDSLSVIDVQRVGNVIIHKVKGDLGRIRENDLVKCEIDWDRRQQLTQHHTATHIINGAARRVLGNHVWQTGAHKSEELGRLDLTHHSRITEEERKEIEKLANRVVSEKRRINVSVMDRGMAEKMYGFRIYQGGAVPGREIRIVDIEDWDVEACGGTHLKNTSEVGRIEIVDTKRIQDGVVRIEFKAGKALERYAERRRELMERLNIEMPREDLQKISSIFSVPVEQLPKTIERFRREWKQQVRELKNMERMLSNLTGERYKFSDRYKELPSGDPLHAYEQLFGEWKSQRKEIKRLKKKIQEILTEKLNERFRSDFIEKEGVKIVKELCVGLDVKNLIEMAKSTVKEDSLLIIANKIDKRANILVYSRSGFNAEEIAKDLSKRLGGGAHGNRNLAIGGGSSTRIEKILREFEL